MTTTSPPPTNAEAGPSSPRPASATTPPAPSTEASNGTGKAKLHGYDFYRSIGSPKYVIAPMVDQSELAWRFFSRQPIPDSYIASQTSSSGADPSSATDPGNPSHPLGGAHLCYTPMINSRLFAYGGPQAKFVESVFDMSTGEEGTEQTLADLKVSDRPLFVQFAGNDPQTLLDAAKKVVGHCDAVDINFGCPQHIAKRGRYGSFLQDEWDLIYSLINTLHRELPIPVTAKFRVFPDVEKTVEYAKMMERAGASILTCHGRTREMKGQFTGLADWEKIKAVKQAVKIPVFANGNLLYREDVDECLRVTGCDGVMTAEGNLSHPALFVPQNSPFSHPPIDVLATHYLDIVEKLQTHTAGSAIKAHLFRILRPALEEHLDLRNKMGASSSGGMVAFREIVQEVKERIEASKQTDKIDVFPIVRDAKGIKTVPSWASQPLIRQILTKRGSGSGTATPTGEGEAVPGNALTDLATGGTGEERVVAASVGCAVGGCGGMPAGACTRAACAMHCRSLGAVEQKKVATLEEAVKLAMSGGLIGCGCEPHEEKERARKLRKEEQKRLKAQYRKRKRGDEEEEVENAKKLKQEA